MMRILEHGKYNRHFYRGACPVCGCTFEFDVVAGNDGAIYADVGTDVILASSNGAPFIAHVSCECPDCKFMLSTGRNEIKDIANFTEGGN